jgi:urease accessory protein
MKTTRFLSSMTLGFLPALAFAHPGHPTTDAAFMEGLLHPLTGFDHLFAIVAVGLLAARQGDRSKWLIPITFASLMLVGALASLIPHRFGGAELIIDISVITLVLAVVLSWRATTIVSNRWSTAVLSLFALAHGYAHGAEASQGINAYYLAGMILATLLLCLIGVAIHKLFAVISNAAAARSSP